MICLLYVLDGVDTVEYFVERRKALAREVALAACGVHVHWV